MAADNWQFVRGVVLVGLTGLLMNLTGSLVEGAMAPDDRVEVLDIHNTLRRQEGSSNMQIMIWDAWLEKVAQNWSDGCLYEHGQGINSSTLSDLDMGQNLFASSGYGVNLTYGVMSWYGEKVDYDYDTLSCAAGKVCGHYTAIVWANTYRVGCGYTVCPILNNVNWTNAFYFVCNYAPAGNYINQKPYVKGSACSTCDSALFWCNDGLCDMSPTPTTTTTTMPTSTTSTPSPASAPSPSPSSSATTTTTSTATPIASTSSPSSTAATPSSTTTDIPIGCQVICLNGGTQTADCRCDCADGWWGEDCSKKCVNIDSRCGGLIFGWPKGLCHRPGYEYVIDNCPVMCKQCVPASGSILVATCISLIVAFALLLDAAIAV